MKLLKTISFLIEQDSGLTTVPWHERVFDTFDIDDLYDDVIKLFGGSIHNLYKALDKIGKGEDFIKHIYHNWEADANPFYHIINALGGLSHWRTGKMDTELLHRFVTQEYMHDIGDLKWDKDRIILELVQGDEYNLFGGSARNNNDDCKYIAKQVFGDEWLEWEPYDIDEKLEELIEILSPENYIKLVRHIGIEFQNEEVDAWREEFDQVREDNGKVIITPSFMNGFLPDNESKRYNLAVLIGNTPELADLEIEIRNAYSRAWNDVVMNQYYDEYPNALYGLLGKPVGDGTTNTYKDIKDPQTGQRRSKLVKVPVKYFDVTDLALDMIVNHAYEVDSPENFLELLNYFDKDNLCPNVDNYPYDENEVNILFQDTLWDYL